MSKKHSSKLSKVYNYRFTSELQPKSITDATFKDFRHTLVLTQTYMWMVKMTKLQKTTECTYFFGKKNISLQTVSQNVVTLVIMTESIYRQTVYSFHRLPTTGFTDTCNPRALQCSTLLFSFNNNNDEHTFNIGPPFVTVYSNRACLHYWCQWSLLSHRKWKTHKEYQASLTEIITFCRKKTNTSLWCQENRSKVVLSNVFHETNLQCAVTLLPP